MKLASLGSGSKGNATLVSHDKTTVLIDCGFGIRKIETKAQALGFNLASLNAILLTHEHSDHVGGVAALAEKYQIPVYLTLGTAKALNKPIRPSLLNYLHGGQELEINDLVIKAVTVPHDCSEPVQFIFNCKSIQKSLGVLTDVGHISSHIIEAYSGLNGLFLEFNYDSTMLANGPYPYHLKQRVGGDYGHLSNLQSINLLSQIHCEQLNTLVVGHISEKNNSPELIEKLFSEKKNLPHPLLATQAEGFSWIEI